jgi:hypothetical protein
MKFDVLTAVKILVFLFRALTTCGLGRYISKYRRYILFPSSELNVEAACSSDAFVSVCKSTPGYSPEEYHGENQ